MRRLARHVAALLIALALGARPARAQSAAPSANRDPDRAKLVTSDLPNFWRALDQSAAGDSAARVRALEDIYLRPGSPGLKAWEMVRLVDQEAVMAKLDTVVWPRARLEAVMRAGDESPMLPALVAAAAPYIDHDAAIRLARTVSAVPAYYATIRRNALSLDADAGMRDSIRARFHRFKAMYPEAVFPDVYFLVGRLTSGGTTAPAGLLLGVEVNERAGRAPDGTPIASTAPAGERVARYAGIIAHELMHYQQHGAGGRALLDASLGEGVADFVAGLVSGAPSPCGTGDRNAWGIAHEGELWSEFSAAALGEKSSDWLYNGGRSSARPADLGYFMGCRVAEAYYGRAKDSHAALVRLFTRDDAAGLLKESGYAARFGTPAAPASGAAGAPTNRTAKTASAPDSVRVRTP
jgi:hypothetical protein